MFKTLEKLLLVFSVIILLSFESAGISNAEEFADGKYFAAVIDTYEVRWNIIVEKRKSSLKVINLKAQDNFDRSIYHYSYLCFGASLKAYVNLMRKRGYIFLGTTLSKINAFFVLLVRTGKIDYYYWLRLVFHNL